MDVKSLKTGDLVTCHYRKDKILKWVAYLIIKDKDETNNDCFDKTISKEIFIKQTV